MDQLDFLDGLALGIILASTILFGIAAMHRGGDQPSSLRRSRLAFFVTAVCLFGLGFATLMLVSEVSELRSIQGKDRAHVQYSLQTLQTNVSQAAEDRDNIQRGMRTSIMEKQKKFRELLDSRFNSLLQQTQDNSSAILDNRLALATGTGKAKFLQTTSGIYRDSVYDRIFSPCGSDAGWAITFATDNIGTEIRSPASIGNYWRVTFKGVLSHTGRFGHMGGMPRVFIVTEVLDTKPAPSQVCE